MLLLMETILHFLRCMKPCQTWMFPKIVGKPPKWMVYFMENPIEMDDLGGFPSIFGNTHMGHSQKKMV